jgi:hypothetical protein
MYTKDTIMIFCEDHKKQNRTSWTSNGPQGVQGSQGVLGPQGPEGDNGDTGPGPTGLGFAKYTNGSRKSFSNSSSPILRQNQNSPIRGETLQSLSICMLLQIFCFRSTVCY